MKVRVESKSKQYDIAFGAVEEVFREYAGILQNRRAIIFSDDNVWPHHGAAIENALKPYLAGYAVEIMEHGETNKNMNTVLTLCRKAIAEHLDRKSLFIAAGGGVTGDICGFAAAIYQRGIDFIQIPTTLLAAVDSSVGGKTGVDLPEGKNLIGAFHQPELVAMDLSFLSTLPVRQLRCGLAEVVKYGVILSREFFDFLAEQNSALLKFDNGIYRIIVGECCRLKAKVVAADECENNLRAILNYGHTFGHAVEKLSNFTIEHGEGVAIGMNMAGQLALDLQMWSKTDFLRQRQLLLDLGLPVTPGREFTPEAIYQSMIGDKKTQSGRVVVILPEALGRVRICRDIPPEKIINAIAGSI
ncbi:MAG: 3-dehydroquinate synthase [Lentisphaeria bacterium]|nr:3-dehydroquinate synthase [Lentisphaeria bacterium]